MKNLRKFVGFLLLLGIITTGLVMANGSGSGALMDVARQDRRSSMFLQFANNAGLAEMYYQNGPFTLLVPTDPAWASIPTDILNRMYTDPNFARQLLLQHTLKGTFTKEQLSTSGSVESGLGKMIGVRAAGSQPIISADIEVLRGDMQASNGTVQIVDGVLNFDGGVFGGTSPNSNGDPYAPMMSQVQFIDPARNPSFRGEGRMMYRVGVQQDSGSCKQLTWVVLGQEGGLTNVGVDRSSNPYRGDTGCYTELPVLCHLRNGAGAPGGKYAPFWSFGEFRATGYIRGTELTSHAAGDAICQRYFGAGWLMAEFHDGGGWQAWGQGTLPIGERLYVAIDDQMGNAWNSIQPRFGPGGSASGRTMTAPEENPAYQGEGRMAKWDGLGAGRSYCKGMTMVIHKQYDGLIKIGADKTTNPYSGDRACTDSYPLLCIHVDGYGPPPSNGLDDFSAGWTGAKFATVGPLSGQQLTTRAMANRICQNGLGQGWRAATFHDGSLGQAGTVGWEMWGYNQGVYATERMWVAISDQFANPWSGQ